MPSRYLNQAYLFTEQVMHSINSEGWETTITAKFRWAPLEDSLRKIRLKKIVPSAGNDTNVIIATTDGIQTLITEDNEVQDDGTRQEKVYGNEAVFPTGIFRSAEAADLIMGGTGDDPESGMGISDVQDKQEAKEDQWETLSERLARLYTIGSNDGDVSESASIMRDVLYKVPEEGGAAKPKGDKSTNAPPKKKVVKPKKRVKTDFTKVKGSATYDGETDVKPPPRLNIPRNPNIPTGPAGGQTFFTQG